MAMPKKTQEKSSDNLFVFCITLNQMLCAYALFCLNKGHPVLNGWQASV
jgi:hypothetical protein